ncbi:MAG: 4Fe-4S binding protein [Planctomycetota bacterium]
MTMASLAVDFCGLLLKNPVVMASAPPTETVDSIARCAEAGAAAAITKTIANFDELAFPLGARRSRLDDKGLWALSTFRRETLTLDAGIRLVTGAVKGAGIPIIASVGALEMHPESWLPTCLAVQEAGAAMIQLDLFYVPHPRCSPASVEQLRTLINYLASRLRIPIAPKLNIELPAHYAAQVLADSPIGAAFAIDSVRVPMPLDMKNGAKPLIQNVPNAGECSMFGAWQKPITLQYARTLAERLRAPLCVGGGLMNGWDAAEAIVFGATTVQFATVVIQKGYKIIRSITQQLEESLDKAGYETIVAARGSAIERFALNEPGIQFGNMTARVDHDTCILCGRCTDIVFCSDISIVDNKIRIDAHCDGCGLCVEVCPTKPKSLAIHPAGVPRSIP